MHLLIWPKQLKDPDIYEEFIVKVQFGGNLWLNHEFNCKKLLKKKKTP